MARSGLALVLAIGGCAGSPKPESDSVEVAKPDASTSDTPAPTRIEAEPDAARPTDECAAGHVCAGTLSPSSGQELRLVAAQTRGCYERALRTNAKLSGRLKVQLRIQPNGQSCTPQLVDSEIELDDAFRGCLLAIFGRSYPRPEGGCVDVLVPVNFQPKNAAGGSPP